MSSSISAAAICLIACHGGPADHFATFAEELTQRGHRVEVYATGPALKKMQERKIENVTEFSLDDEKNAAIQIAEKCSNNAVVITDVGHQFAETFHYTLEKQAPKVLRLAYYDNPEPYVPGGYSETASKVMRAAQKVLFANANLVKDDKREMGIGYYPVAQAEKIAKLRTTDREKIREKLFAQWRMKDEGQQILVYAGGCNDEYFDHALPAFLEFLSEAAQDTDISRFVVMIQQHPRAKERKTESKMVDDWLIKAPRLFLSKINSDEAQIVADRMLYYQTSMGPQFVLANIPTTQVGHKPYEDILVKNKLCSVATNEIELLEAILPSEQPSNDPKSREKVIEGLGIRKDWADRLEASLIQK